MFAPGRKLIGVVLGFALVTVATSLVMDRKGLTLLEPYVNDTRAERLYAYLTRPETEDVLIIGSSRVVGGLDSRMLTELLSEELGEPITVYKLGIPGLRPLFLSEVLEKAVSRRPPRRLLVLAVETRNFVIPASARAVRRAESRAREGADEGIRGEWEADEMAASFWQTFDGLRALWNLPWMRSDHTRQVAAFLQETGGEPITVAERMRIEAQQVRYRQDKRDIFELPPGMAWKWSGPDAPDMVGFARTLEIAETLPTKTIFIRMNLERGFDAESMPKVSQRLRGEVVPEIRRRGFEYHDLNTPAYPLDPRFFMSKTHLNRWGCEETSKAIVSELLAPLLRSP